MIYSHTQSTALPNTLNWLQGADLNRRLPGYEPVKLPLLHPVIKLLYYRNGKSQVYFILLAEVNAPSKEANVL